MRTLSFREGIQFPLSIYLYIHIFAIFCWLGFPVKKWLALAWCHLHSRLGSAVQSRRPGAEIRQCHVGPKVESQTGRVVGGWRLDSDVWDGWETHYGSMEKWYIHLHEWLIFMVNVGEYTIHGSWWEMFFLRIGGLPSRKLTYPTWGKGK